MCVLERHTTPNTVLRHKNTNHKNTNTKHIKIQKNKKTQIYKIQNDKLCQLFMATCLIGYPFLHTPFRWTGSVWRLRIASSEIYVNQWSDFITCPGSTSGTPLTPLYLLRDAVCKCTLGRLQIKTCVSFFFIYACYAKPLSSLFWKRPEQDNPSNQVHPFTGQCTMCLCVCITCMSIFKWCFCLGNAICFPQVLQLVLLIYTEQNYREKSSCWSTYSKS